MQRYTRTLSAHVTLVHEHAKFLVNRMKYHALKSSGDLSLDLDRHMIRAKEIQLELMVVEEFVKEYYPEITDLFDGLKLVELTKKEDDEG